MKKKSILFILLAAVFLLSACSPGGESTKRGQEMGYFTYPGTDWGMTVEEVRTAIGKTEKTFTRLANAVDGNESYLAECDAFGAPANVIFNFDRLSEDDDPYLFSVQITFQGENADYRKRRDAFCSYLDRQGVPYEKSAEERQRTVLDEDGNEKKIEVQTDDELYADGVRAALLTFGVSSVKTVSDLPKETREAADAYCLANDRDQFPDGFSVTENYGDVALSRAVFWDMQDYTKDGALEKSKLVLTLGGTIAMVEQYAAAQNQ